MTPPSAPIKLSVPIPAPAAMLTHVRLQIPARGFLNKSPTDLDQRRWNLAQILDLPLSAILQLSDADVGAIAREWRAYADRMGFPHFAAADLFIVTPSKKACINGR